MTTGVGWIKWKTSFQSMITLTLEQSKLSTLRHEQTLTEIRELIELQKEQRIDIMALF